MARELFRRSAAEVEPSFGHLRRALVPLQGRPKTDPIFLLIWIRNAFAKAGVSLPAFDLSLAIMWEKTRSGDPFPTLENPWLHRAGSAMSDALPDGVGLVREALEETAGTIPLLGFLAKRGTRWAFDKGKKAWLEETRPQLQAFYRDGALIEDHEMPGRLPWMLAQDLNRHLKDHPADRFVLLIDEYEGLIEGAGTGPRWQENVFDIYLRDFVKETDGLLLLIFSRERLHWEDHPDWRKDLKGNQHLLGGLPDEDAEDWLRKVPVDNAEIRAAMIEGARETPDPTAPVYALMLELQVTHWRQLGEEAVPADFEVAARSFEARRLELVTRIMRGYGGPIQDVLARLAVVQRFDRTAFEAVTRAFNIPLADSDFDRIAALSMMSAGDEGWLTPHRAIADAIVEAEDPARLESSRRFLLSHFTDRAKPERITDVEETTLACLAEAARLRRAEGADGYVDWLNAAGVLIHRARRDTFLEWLWREALDMSLVSLGTDHPDTAASYNNVASNLDAQGRAAEAEPLYRKALEINERVLGTDHPDTTASYNNVAYNLDAQGRVAEAEPLYRKALEIRERLLGTDHPDTATSYNNVASNLNAQGRAAEAEPLSRKALEIRECVLGTDHPSTAASYNNVACNLDAQGRAAEAEPLYRKALEIRERVLGPDHPDTAASYNNIASNLDDQGQAAEAEPLYRRALEIRERVLGTDHPSTAASYNNVAYNLNAQGRAVEAEPLFRKALEIRERVLGTDHPDTAASYNNVAMNLDAQGRAAEAEPLYRKALEIRERVLGTDHPSTAASYNNVAYNLNAQGRAAEAETLSRKALEIRERVLGTDHPYTAASYDNLASNLDAQGRTAEAETLSRKALEIRERVLGADHPSTAASYNNLASNLDAQGRAAEAEPLLRKALEISERVLGTDHPSTAASYNNVAANLKAQGRAAEAEPLLRKALEISERVLGTDHPSTAVSSNNLASNLDAQGRAAEAEPLLRKALEISERVLGTDHPTTRMIRANLEAFLQRP
ncbi:tetratricopeptide repeat protein [Rhodovulum visakhapatnamense]|uniref:Tetratricopeptide repeat protein n=1 Tax=Rhodovulum visakhapatnamense TaxID=364297 RepID=A0ABS1RLH8_9RHOB|nr:tetratricopeptide repeat protein [Rhodovulum visakhapatnamense]MBL3571532.1 tetratricopeptide repeat protein [Rhodovulum visakhapatnamense]MBL3580541.1 tetratricopeptide repeat protein [Rhodovulum visakhapatnamense]